MRRVIIGGALLAVIGAVIVAVAVAIGSEEVGATTYDATFGDAYQSCGTPLAPRIQFAGPVKAETMAEQCAPYTSDRTGPVVLSIAAGCALMGSGATAVGFSLALRDVFGRARRERRMA